MAGPLPTYKRLFTGAMIALAIAAGAFSCLFYFFYGWGAAQGYLRDKALDTARPSAPYLSDFLRLFPDAKVRYFYFGSPDEPGYDVSVDLHGRYQLTMQLPAHFDRFRLKVIGYGQPRFYLWEVSTAKRLAGGGQEFTYAGGTTFSAAGWKKIVEKNGDFSAVGYPLITNQPVAGFK